MATLQLANAIGRHMSGHNRLIMQQGFGAGRRIKNILLMVGLAFDAPDIFQRLTSLGLSGATLFYFFLYIILAFGLWMAAQIRNSIIRWATATALASATMMMDSFAGSTGEFMSYDAFINMLNSAAFIGDALKQHLGAMLWAGLAGLFILIGIGLRPAKTPRLSALWTIGVPASVLAILSTMLFLRGGEGGKALPEAWVGSSYAALVAYEALANRNGPRQLVSIPRAKGPVGHDIVLIIDESIAGNYLDINNKAGVRSGLAQSVNGLSITNFGLATASTNCSFGANKNLHFGGTRARYKQIIATMPSIWSYAKKAGLSTVYIDAQREHGGLQNGMDGAELRDVDRFVQFNDVSVVNRDMAAADALASALNNGKPEFILVNKVGAHFPVADKYPDSFQQYKPAMPRGQSLNVADINMRDKMVDGRENWRLYRNSYRNILLWNVGSFFDRLLAKAKIGDALIIYTSDHGQDLHERGNPGSTTHCNIAPNMDEGVVPLVVIGKAGSEKWVGAAKQNYNASSHFRIFPTLLKEMGFDAKKVSQIYGEGLDANNPDPMTFNRLFNARLGRKPEWQNIRLEQINQPSVSDYQK